MSTGSNRLCKMFSVFLLFATFPGLGIAQEGVSSASVGLSRARIGSTRVHEYIKKFNLPSPDMIRVEEFINYHRHHLPLPLNNERVRLDAKRLLLPNGHSVFQFGITTPRNADPAIFPSLNLVLVIDVSGSMAGERIQYVKKSLNAFAQRLREKDTVSIVTFSSNSTVAMKACSARSERFLSTIERMQAGGATNLHAGLMMGYREAVKQFDPDKTNRVILLTDGKSNRGVTSTQTIARQSQEFNDEGIELSTIGLGNDFNHDLLRKLSDAGRGLLHFVGDCHDMEKTFVREADSLLAPAARNVKLKLEMAGLSDETRIFGYQPKKLGDSIHIPLDHLNYGVTQVVVAQVSQKYSEILRHSDQLKASLEFEDAVTRQAVCLKASVDLNGFESEPEKIKSLRRNFAIGVVASAFSEAAHAEHRGCWEDARTYLKRGVRRAQRIASRQDPHVTRVVKIVEGYLAENE